MEDTDTETFEPMEAERRIHTIYGSDLRTYPLAGFCSFRSGYVVPLIPLLPVQPSRSLNSTRSGPSPSWVLLVPVPFFVLPAWSLRILTAFCFQLVDVSELGLPH